jgi:PhnB protein
VYVEDADATFDQATAAGAEATTPLENMFWGDRFGTVTDPFGHVWSIATHIEDVPPEEMAERAKAAMAEMGAS